MYICFLQKVSPSGDKRHLKSGKAFVFHSQGSNSPKFSFGLKGLIVVWNKKKETRKKLSSGSTGKQIWGSSFEKG